MKGVFCHYLACSYLVIICTCDLIVNCIFFFLSSLNQGEEGKPNYIGKIVEFFETTKQEFYFTAQWFFRPEDTVRQFLKHKTSLFML